MSWVEIFESFNKREAPAYYVLESLFAAISTFLYRNSIHLNQNLDDAFPLWSKYRIPLAWRLDSAL